MDTIYIEPKDIHHVDTLGCEGFSMYALNEQGSLTFHNQ